MQVLLSKIDVLVLTESKTDSNFPTSQFTIERFSMEIVNAIQI